MQKATHPNPVANSDLGLNIADRTQDNNKY